MFYYLFLFFEMEGGGGGRGRGAEAHPTPLAPPSLLFLLMWPHTPQAFLETSLPSRPLLLERTGQPTTPGTTSPTLIEYVCGFLNFPQGINEHGRYL